MAHRGVNPAYQQQQRIKPTLLHCFTFLLHWRNKVQIINPNSNHMKTPCSRNNRLDLSQDRQTEGGWIFFFLLHLSDIYGRWFTPTKHLAPKRNIPLFVVIRALANSTLLYMSYFSSFRISTFAVSQQKSWYSYCWASGNFSIPQSCS